MTGRPPYSSELEILKEPFAFRANRSAFLGVMIVLVAAAVIGGWLLHQSPTILTLGCESLILWSALAGVIHFLSSFGLEYNIEKARKTASEKGSRFLRAISFLFNHYFSFTQWVIFAGGIAMGGIWLAVEFVRRQEFAYFPKETIRLEAIGFITMGGVLYLLCNYGLSLQRRLTGRALVPLLRLAMICWVACVVTAVVYFIYMSFSYDRCEVGWVFMGLGVVLAVEPLLIGIGRFYQPKTLRKGFTPIGASVLLDFALGSGTDSRGLIKDLENLVGMKVGDIWILGFAREMLEPVMIVGLVVGWISTTMSSVPLGYKGVLVSWGCYAAQSLSPGLHMTWPWPFEQVILVPTERLQDISLGFEKDLSKPLLWTEKHVEGEKNLLIGDGESLLTINVPVIYRIADPVAYVCRATDVRDALRNLAERQLIHIAVYREAFHMMVEDRQAIADKLRQSLQSEVDRMGLGLEIVYVGLKDIHPPVTVAPAYEAVVSAQEKKDAMVDEAVAYEASTLPGVQAQALELVTVAESAATERVRLAEGESIHFERLVEGERIEGELLKQRLRYDVLDEILPRPSKTIVGVSGKSAAEYFIDLRTSPGNRSAGAAMATP
jgi:regulator of protease activity HflC (stomatin/prohibitin superfamily)